MKRLLPIGLSPNLEPDDVWLAIKSLMEPWRYWTDPAVEELRASLQRQFSATGVWLFNSGRAALLTYLQALHLPAGSTVAVQAFTCNAVINPILWAGLQPIYIDITYDSLTMAPADLAKKITPQTKVVIIQHTFGQTADLTALLQIARDHNCIVIEDCAHALGGRFNQRLLGTFGDAAIFSFGRDKVISSVYGGMLLVNRASQHRAVAQQYNTVTQPTGCWIVQQLLHPIITYVAVVTWYWFGFGRVLFALAQRLGLLSLAVSRTERQTRQPNYFPKRLPGSLARLAVQQYNKLDRFNRHRLAMAQIYQQTLFPNQPLAQAVWLRYTVRSQKRAELFSLMQHRGIILGDWYWNVVVPTATDLSRLGYHAGSCPTAEAAAKTVINLPTTIATTADRANTIAAAVKPYL